MKSHSTGNRNMKIGVFDSGLGGLIVTRAIRKMMPEYDYVYYGDTKRVPYGNKSNEAVFGFTKEAVDHLFEKENCAIVILACNTASARALKQIQNLYLKENKLDKKVLGVLIPAAEVASKYSRIGVIATRGTVASNTFPIEIMKLNNKVKVFQNPAPMLVPLIEEGENKRAKPFISEYLKPFENKNLDALVLGCTHYPMFKKEIKDQLPKSVKIISQDEIVPERLKDYLKRHTEISEKLSKGRSIKIITTDKAQNMAMIVKKWFGSTKNND